MAGLTQYGPVPYLLTNPAVTMTPRPTLVTSFTEFERAFGSLYEVGSTADRQNYLAYAARAFFDNGGRRLYVSRVFPFTRDNNDLIDVDANFAKLSLGTAAVWRARWPGAAGAQISVQIAFRRSKNVLIGGALKGLDPGAVVEVFATPAQIPGDKDKTAPKTTAIVVGGPGNTRSLQDANGAAVDPTGKGISHITLDVTVSMGALRTDTYTGLEVGDAHPRAVARVMSAEQPTDSLSLVWLDVAAGTKFDALVTSLVGLAGATYLTGGGEGDAVSPADLKGEPSDPDDPKKAATGLAALGEVDDIAIVALPDSVRFNDEDTQATAVQNLIEHCETLRYRIGIVDPPKEQAISGVREFRSRFDTKYAALNYPWV
jgi:hypothetical protein